MCALATAAVSRRRDGRMLQNARNLRARLVVRVLTLLPLSVIRLPALNILNIWWMLQLIARKFRLCWIPALRTRSCHFNCLNACFLVEITRARTVRAANSKSLRMRGYFSAELDFGS